jgi:ABC-type uncharacterized transport system substrate-binding protein
MPQRQCAQWNEALKRLLLLLLFISKPLFAAAEMDIARIDIIVAPDNAAAADLADTIQQALQKAQLGVETAVKNSINYQSNNAATTLVITIGDSSLASLNNKKTPFAGVIAFYVNSALFRQSDIPALHTTAIYRDQPLLRQLRLGKLLLPNLQRVTILHSPRELIPSIETLQRESLLTIHEVVFDNRSEWPKLLSLALHESDFLLGIDDSDIYNSNSIRSILLTAYRHGKGLIGPSRAFVNAGGLASCYTTTDQYQQQLVEMVTVVLHEHRLPHPQYPNKFHVAINKQVATSLNIPIPDEKTLSAWLQNQDGECGNGC